MRSYHFEHSIGLLGFATFTYDVENGSVVRIHETTSPNVFRAAQEHYDSLTIQERHGVDYCDGCQHSEDVQNPKEAKGWEPEPY